MVNAIIDHRDIKVRQAGTVLSFGTKSHLHTLMAIDTAGPYGPETLECLRYICRIHCLRQVIGDVTSLIQLLAAMPVSGSTVQRGNTAVG